MILKHHFFVFFIFLLCASCGEKDNVELEPSITIEDCKKDEFYTRMLINGECWTSTKNFFYKVNEETGIYDIRLENVANLTEGLHFLVNADNEQKDKVFLRGNRSSSVLYVVEEGFDSVVVLFEPKYLMDTESNWIIIDSISLDSTIISGRFEAILYRNGEGNQAIYPSPEKLVITDGQFRVKRKE